MSMALQLGIAGGVRIAAIASISRPEPSGMRQPACGLGKRRRNCCLEGTPGVPYAHGNAAAAAAAATLVQFSGQRSCGEGAKLQPWLRKGGRRRHFSVGNNETERRRGAVSTAAVAAGGVDGLLDPHAWAFLAEVVDPSKFPVAIELDPTRAFIDESVVSRLSEGAIKACYMVGVLVFSWGCCVFGSMNEPFYDSDEYLDAGGDGSGHWIYDRQEREERAAREEIWSEDLLKELEDKAAEDEDDEQKKKKEVELV